MGVGFYTLYTGLRGSRRAKNEAYEQGTNKLTHIEGTPPTDFGYDANANITSETGWTYIYDLSNQLIRVLQDSNQVAEYTYNGAGQRIKKVTQTETRIFHYDLRGHLIAETNQTGQMLAEYVYLGDQLLAMIQPGETVYYFHNDHLGTPQVLTDDAQAVAWKAAYTPFGQAVASIQTVDNPFRFPGQYYDQETGLHYNYFRYYNPQTGRYITPDPIGLEGGINLFAYVQGNSITLTDRLGLDPIDPRTGKDNPVTRCHVVTHNDPEENLYGAIVVIGGLGIFAVGPEAVAVASRIPSVVRNLFYRYAQYTPVAQQWFQRWVQGPGLFKFKETVSEQLRRYEERHEGKQCPEKGNDLLKCH